MVAMWIAGEPYHARPRFEGALIDPMSREEIARVPYADRDDVDHAFKIARRSCAHWQAVLPDEREQIFHQLARLLSEQQLALSVMIMEESGSTLAKAMHEVSYAASILRAAAGEARRLYGETMPDDKHDRISMVNCSPLGVVAVISPFNAPMALLAKMLAFPLAAGNTLVIKPSEECPRIATKLASLFTEAGLPPGALNVLHGAAETGAMMVDHPELDGLTFTGSTASGQKIGAVIGRHLKSLHLELGGNNPLIVMPDFDLDEAVKLAVFGSFFHAGQICMASSRILVADNIYQEFKELFVKAAESLSFGKLDDETTFYGPLINQRAVDQSMQRLIKAKQDGVRIVSGGEISDGWRLLPTICEQVSVESDLWREETFAPVVSLKSFANLGEAIALANDSAYGLSAGFLGRDYRQGLRAAREIRCGAVHLGSHPFQSGAMTPVGGVGLSGVGKSGGHYSTEHFTQKKWISFHL